MGQMDGRVLIRPETDSCSKRATGRNERYANGTDMDKETKVDAKTFHQQNSAGISINKSEKLWAKRLVFKSGQITTSGRTSVWHKIPQSPTDGYQLDLLRVANPFRGLHQDVPQWQTWPFSGRCSYKQFTSLSPCVIRHSGLFRLPVYRIR